VHTGNLPLGYFVGLTNVQEKEVWILKATHEFVAGNCWNPG
jgi:hypothetical protein